MCHICTHICNKHYLNIKKLHSIIYCRIGGPSGEIVVRNKSGTKDLRVC